MENDNPTIRFKIENRYIIIKDLTRFKGSIKFKEKDSLEELKRQYPILIKDKSIKLQLINLALHFYEDYNLYFESEKETVPYIKKEISIKKEETFHRDPKEYFEYLFNNLKEDWHVSVNCFDRWELYPLKPSMTNFPDISIRPKSVFMKDCESIKKRCKESEKKLKKMLELCILNNYKFKIINKREIRGQVILIKSANQGEVFSLKRESYYLFTNTFLRDAILEDFSKEPLSDGIYDIKAIYNYKDKIFIIKKAKLLHNLEEFRDPFHIPIKKYSRTFLKEIGIFYITKVIIINRIINYVIYSFLVFVTLFGIYYTTLSPLWKYIIKPLFN